MSADGRGTTRVSARPSVSGVRLVRERRPESGRWVCSRAGVSDLGKSGPCDRGGEGLRGEFQKNGGKGVLTYTRGKVQGGLKREAQTVGQAGVCLCGGAS